MNRDSWWAMAGVLVLVVIGMFVVFWVAVRAMVAFGFIGVVLVLLAFAWWYDRREKRARAGVGEP
jgi:hypothetical protein